MHSLGDDEPFPLRLAQAIAWCSPRARLSDPASSLRSDRLRPWVLSADRAATVRQVLLQRASAPGLRAATQARGSADLDGGRLLLYFPDANLFDGAAEAETGGYFDVENVPPWDTWIGLFRDESGDASFADCLVSWVPGHFVALVDRGISVNPEECIVWLSDSSAPVAHALGSEGLLGS